jgi:hypothetical protein
MSTSHSPKRSASSSNSVGAKILITAASLATLVGGWAALARQQSTQKTQANLDVPDDTTQFILDLPPLPTLVPEPSSIPIVKSPDLPGSHPVAFSPYSTPIAIVPMVKPLSGSSQKDPSGKTGEIRAPKEPTTKTGSS